MRWEIVFGDIKIIKIELIYNKFAINNGVHDDILVIPVLSTLMTTLLSDPLFNSLPTLLFFPSAPSHSHHDHRQ